MCVCVIGAMAMEMMWNVRSLPSSLTVERWEGSKSGFLGLIHLFCVYDLLTQLWICFSVIGLCRKGTVFIQSFALFWIKQGLEELVHGKRYKKRLHLALDSVQVNGPYSCECLLTIGGCHGHCCPLPWIPTSSFSNCYAQDTTSTVSNNYVLWKVCDVLAFITYFLYYAL